MNDPNLIIPIKKPKQIANKLYKIMNFKTQKKTNLLKGLKSNLSNFNISLISQKYLEIYQNIILIVIPKVMKRLV